MRKPLIAGNWKMNNTIDEAVTLVNSLLKSAEEYPNVEIVICPPFVSLASVEELLKSSSIKLGAQNIHYEDKGAFTGEVSPLMLKDICQYVIIGHSERRQYFNDDEFVNRKIKAALKCSINPILCIGEKAEENEAGLTKNVLERQLEQALIGIEGINNMVIAYEPIWAIGTGKSAGSEQANKTIGDIRHKISSLYGVKTASNIRILYGGSANADNIAEFVGQSEIDGALVGGVSLKPEQFINMVKITSAVYI